MIGTPSIGDAATASAGALRGAQRVVPVGLREDPAELLAPDPGDEVLPSCSLSRRLATSVRAASPRSWPSRSLTPLKSSTSRITTDIGRPLRSARDSSAIKALSKARRFASPVRASVTDSPSKSWVAPTTSVRASCASARSPGSRAGRRAPSAPVAPATAMRQPARQAALPGGGRAGAGGSRPPASRRGPG